MQNTKEAPYAENSEQISKVLKNHPDCVPVRFLLDTKSKLNKAEKDFIVYGRKLQMKQPMFYVYDQIQQKGLYFYVQDKKKWKLLNPDFNIGKVYDRHHNAKTKVLYIMYSDRNLTESRCLNGVFYVSQGILLVYVLLYCWLYVSKWLAGDQPEPSPKN